MTRLATSRFLHVANGSWTTRLIEFQLLAWCRTRLPGTKPVSLVCGRVPRGTPDGPPVVYPE